MLNRENYKYNLLSLAVVGLLIVAVFFNHDYPYYIVLRWICSPIFLYLALICHRRNLEGWKWTFGVIGLLYNPILPIHLNRTYWMIVNLLTIALLSIWNFYLKRYQIIERNASIIK